MTVCSDNEGCIKTGRSSRLSMRPMLDDHRNRYEILPWTQHISSNTMQQTMPNNYLVDFSVCLYAGRIAFMANKWTITITYCTMGLIYVCIYIADNMYRYVDLHITGLAVAGGTDTESKSVAPGTCYSSQHNANMETKNDRISFFFLVFSCFASFCCWRLFALCLEINEKCMLLTNVHQIKGYIFTTMLA